nr:hypothetical protein CFP56_13491 [Quercus suber]
MKQDIGAVMGSGRKSPFITSSSSCSAPTAVQPHVSSQRHSVLRMQGSRLSGPPADVLAVPRLPTTSTTFVVGRWRLLSTSLTNPMLVRRGSGSAPKDHSWSTLTDTGAPRFDYCFIMDTSQGQLRWIMGRC